MNIDYSLYYEYRNMIYRFREVELKIKLLRCGNFGSAYINRHATIC